MRTKQAMAGDQPAQRRGSGDPCAPNLITGLPPQLRICRGCGCDDLSACPGGCVWACVDIDTATGVCTTCAVELAWDPNEMASTADGLEQRRYRLS